MTISIQQLFLGAGVAGAIALAAARARMLAPSGAWAAFVLGSIVFGVGGLAWSIPLIAFFITGSALSKFGPRRKRGLERVFEKGSTRDAGQVWANGGMAGLCVLAHAFVPDPLLFAAYLGSLAAAAADTWATEIGVLGRGRTIGLPRFRVVPRGESGGISLLGTLGAAAGALVVASSGAFAAALPAMAIAAVAGMAGMFADSIVGGTIQARYRCDVCGTITEQRIHCAAPARLVRGYRVVTNDVVNVICTLVGGVVAYVLGRVWG